MYEGVLIMAVTIKQIAELATVSRGTVDKVLNHRPGVKEETRQKVLKIAKELNYQPNFLGKALVQSKDPIKIGIILTPEYNPYIQEMLTGVKSAQNEFYAFGIDIRIKMPISLEPAEQISILNELEAEGVNGMAVFPIDDNMVRNKINQLVDNGIAIITFNSKIEGTNDFCFVGQDHRKGGKTAAGLLAKLLPSGGDVGVIISSYRLSCHQDRLNGFLDKLQEASSCINVLEVQENQDRKEDAFKITLEYCNQHPQLKGLYITGGGIAGVGSALSLLNLSHNVAVICHDLIPDTLALLQDGTVDFALGQSPEFQGYQLVKILFEYLVKKQNPASRDIEIPITIATQDSI
jgi:LacI family transcriptional regulator